MASRRSRTSGPLGTWLRRLARTRDRVRDRVRAGVRSAVARVRPPHPGVVELAAVRRRLELVVTALHGRPIGIEAVRPARGRGLARLFDLVSRREPPPLASTDGSTVQLPPRLALGDAEASLAHYRLLAMEQAERVVRGTAACVPTEPLERDLYLVAEGAAVDGALARGGATRTVLAAARATTLAERPPLGLMPPMERRVESLVRAVLAGDGGATGMEDRGAAADPPPAGPPACATPADSLRWARETAASMTTADRSGALAYRGIPPVALWGTPRAPTDPGIRPLVELAARESHATGDSSPDAPIDQSDAEATVAAPAEGTVGEAGASDADVSPTVRHAPADPSPESDPFGAGARLPDSATDARTVAEYPEWDAGAKRYRPRAATVVQWRPAEAPGNWAQDELRRHAPLVRRVRERFERLRAQRVRLRRQRTGDELDLEACVRAAVDRRMGRPIDDRVYLDVRPARRPIAILLLVDVSGSTDAPVGAGRQVIDVEKSAVLLAGEALDALGDPYAVLAFSSRTGASVHVRVVKEFAERSSDAVRRRVAGLAPEANTRLGAAVRHATALLSRQLAGHRLLLILSDGQPNDVDHYQGDFAVEDARQAIHEARAAGVHPFCLTVDREDPGYLARIFGAAGYTIMRHPEQLPAALLRGVSDLLGG